MQFKSTKWLLLQIKGTSTWSLTHHMILSPTWDDHVLRNTNMFLMLINQQGLQNYLQLNPQALRKLTPQMMMMMRLQMT